jgi:hypothetical protein
MDYPCNEFIADGCPAACSDLAIKRIDSSLPGYGVITCDEVPGRYATD